MSFVRLENLNDFIQPTASCTKPLSNTKGTVGKVNEVNLSDCLACSGCITSSESVLIQQQNNDELFKVINDNKTSKIKRDVVVSLSLQSIASLANRYGIADPQETAEKLASFFISIGCSQVYDLNLARHIALVEVHQEYKQRKQNGLRGPTLSSVCPGWICYVEKTNGDLVIPHLSKVRSPQQIMGSLLKKNKTTNKGVSANNVFHVTVMPCFDKKLEASRSDFKEELEGSSDVDCVLTPIEIEEILNSEDVTLSEFERRPLDVLIQTGYQLDNPLTSHIGSPSGGYAENLLISEAVDKLKLPRERIRGDIEYTQGKNADIIELRLKNPNSGENSVNVADLPNVAVINGFRNIQTVVQRLKRKMLQYDYIEIMACPSGCTNGGAQSKPAVGSGDQKSTLELVNSLYRLVDPINLSTTLDESNRLLYHNLGLQDQQARQRLLYTNFHSVPKSNTLNVSW